MRNFGQANYGWWYTEGDTSGWCTDHKGLLGTPGAKVSCADLRSAQEAQPVGTYEPYTPPADDSLVSQAGEKLDEVFGITDPKAAKIPVVAYVLVLGLAGLGIHTFMKQREA